MKFNITFVSLVSSALVLLGSSEAASSCGRMEEVQFRDLAKSQGLDYKNPKVTFHCQDEGWTVSNDSRRSSKSNASIRANGLVTLATQGNCKEMPGGYRACWNYGGFVYNDRNRYSTIAKYTLAHNAYRREEEFDGMGRVCSPDSAFCFDIMNGMCFWYYMNQNWSKYCYELPILNFDV
ncbi:MAG: hypothetical protein J3R72DRAFT_418986 [Linnemannia gamsii]|nr:MAG: hypothetical protein J3R72DRAFT_418986 [Linnemannia gamsii]